MSVTEFDGRDFAVGVVTGVRSFNVDQHGRLTGVSYKKVWRPGENTAICLKRQTEDYASFAAGVSYFFSSSVYYRPSLPVSHPLVNKTSEFEKLKSHSLATCSCGFYGYYDGSNDYKTNNRISAVVEGYGEVLIGTRGFRASKARIVALRLPEKRSHVEAVGARQIERIRRNYPEVPVFTKFRDMVAAFPPDTAFEVSPENDPSFWEKD